MFINVKNTHDQEIRLNINTIVYYESTPKDPRAEARIILNNNDFIMCVDDVDVIERKISAVNPSDALVSIRNAIKKI